MKTDFHFKPFLILYAFHVKYDSKLCVVLLLLKLVFHLFELNMNLQ